MALDPAPIASTVTGHRRFLGTSWRERSPLLAMARRDSRWDSECSASATGLATAPWPSTWPRGTQPRAFAGRRRLHGGREPADLGPHCVAGTVPARPPSGGAERPRARRGRRSRGRTATQLAREAGAYVIGTGRAADRQTALDFGAQEFVDLENDALEDIGGVDLVFDVIGGDIGKRSAGLIRAGGTLVSVVGPPEARPARRLGDRLRCRVRSWPTG